MALETERLLNEAMTAAWRTPASKKALAEALVWTWGDVYLNHDFSEVRRVSDGSLVDLSDVEDEY